MEHKGKICQLQVIVMAQLLSLGLAIIIQPKSSCKSPAGYYSVRSTPL